MGENEQIAIKGFKRFPINTQDRIRALPQEQLEYFEKKYTEQRKSPLKFFFIALLFPVQHFILGKPMLGVFFILSVNLIIWWAFELLYTPLKRVPEENKKIANQLLNQTSHAFSQD